MVGIIKDLRGRTPKRYLGAMGSYLFEILDDHPLIPKITTKSQYYLCLPPEGSRLGGSDGRMILKIISDDALIFIRIKKRCKKNYTGIMILLISRSEIPSRAFLMRDPLLLVAGLNSILRWLLIRILSSPQDIQGISLHKPML